MPLFAKLILGKYIADFRPWALSVFTPVSCLCCSSFTPLNMCYIMKLETWKCGYKSLILGESFKIIQNRYLVDSRKIKEIKKKKIKEIIRVVEKRLRKGYQ